MTTQTLQVITPDQLANVAQTVTQSLIIFLVVFGIALIAFITYMVNTRFNDFHAYLELNKFSAVESVDDLLKAEDK